MENLALFCCKSCLRGEGDNKELYLALGLESKRSTLDEIKKAYKKKSLNLHPDKLAQRGITVTEEHSKEFLRVKEAYDILSDPKRRKMYDQIGLNGLKLIENPSEVDPTVFLNNFQKNRRDRVIILTVILLLFGLIFYLPVLFALKCDGKISDFPWMAVWMPMWIVNLVLIISAFLLFTMDTSEKPKKTASDGTVMEEKKASDEDDADEDENGPNVVIPIHEKVLNLFNTLLFVLIQIFVFMRMDNDVSWNWFAVFIPWFLYEGISILATIPTAIAVIALPNHENVVASPAAVEDGTADEDIGMQHLQLESKYFDDVMTQVGDRKSIIVSLLRIWQAIFLAVQLNTGYKESWDWGVVFIPIWLYLAMEAGLALYYRNKGLTIMDGIDIANLFDRASMDYVSMAKVSQAQQMVQSAKSSLYMLLIPLFISILMVCRLQVSSSHYSTFIILLPFFVILGCTCVCTFCFMVTMANVDTEKLKEEMAARNQGEQSAQDGNAEPEVTVIITPENVETSSATMPAPKNYSPPPVPIASPPVTSHTEVAIDMID